MTTPPIELAATVERQRDEIREGFRLTINRASRESASNTHDFVLADFLMRCLEAFEESTRLREHLRSPAPSPAETFSNEEKAALYKSGWDFGFAHAKSMLSPAETGAVPVDLIRKAAMALENVGKYGVASDLYAWLATQKGTR